MQAAESLFISKSFKSAPIKRMKIRRELICGEVEDVPETFE